MERRRSLAGGKPREDLRRIERPGFRVVDEQMVFLLHDNYNKRLNRGVINLKSAHQRVGRADQLMLPMR